MKLTHITTDGERWDSIAWHYYQRINLTPFLIAANPHLPITASLGAGLVMTIPIIEHAALAIENIPEWAR